MTYMIEVLRQEHCNIERLLRVLERELGVFDCGDRPDYEVILGVIEYFKDYPDSCHHPKEDMIIKKLKARDPVRAADVRRVSEAIQRVLSDQDLLRQNVHNVIRDFIDHERQHMAMEERVVFPTALNALEPEDWTDIGVKLGDRQDPLYQPGFEERFKTLRRGILAMEAEAEAERVASFHNKDVLE
jgi:hemerythrin-like domain-containing protein